MERLPASTDPPLSRGRIAIRLLYTVLFLFILGVVWFLIKLTTFFQYLLLFFTLQVSEPVRRFTNQLCRYAYEITRYITLNSNERPFPFREFPQDLEAPAAEVNFD